jgi:hypothetical protein
MRRYSNMKLWMIIEVVGRVGGVVGPLPYDWKECIMRRDLIQMAVNEKFVEHYAWLGGRAYWMTRGDVKYKCLASEETPTVDKD